MFLWCFISTQNKVFAASKHLLVTCQLIVSLVNESLLNEAFQKFVNLLLQVCKISFLFQKVLCPKHTVDSHYNKTAGTGQLDSLWWLHHCVPTPLVYFPNPKSSRNRVLAERFKSTRLQLWAQFHGSAYRKANNLRLWKQRIPRLRQAYFTGWQGIFACARAYSMLLGILRSHSAEIWRLHCKRRVVIISTEFGGKQSHEIRPWCFWLAECGQSKILYHNCFVLQMGH